jgi:hypothetical protein
MRCSSLVSQRAHDVRRITRWIPKGHRWRQRTLEAWRDRFTRSNELIENRRCVPYRYETRHGLTMVGNDYGFASSHSVENLTRALVELTNANPRHLQNVEQMFYLSM